MQLIASANLVVLSRHISLLPITWKEDCPCPNFPPQYHSHVSSPAANQLNGKPSSHEKTFKYALSDENLRELLQENKK